VELKALLILFALMGLVLLHPLPSRGPGSKSEMAHTKVPVLSYLLKWRPVYDLGIRMGEVFDIKRAENRKGHIVVYYAR